MSGRHGGDGKTAGWLRGQLADMTRRLAEAEADRARLRAELAEAEQHIKAQSEVDRILAAGFSPAANGDTGPLPAVRVRGPRAAGYRAPRDRHGLRIVPGFVPLAAAARQGWGWAAHHTAATVTGATAATAVVAGAGIITLAAPPPAATATHRASPPPAAGLWDATPMVPPSAAAVKPKADVARSRPLVTPSPSYPYATAPAPGTAPASSSPPGPPPAPQGTLDVTQATVTLRPGTILGELTGELDLTAVGGDVTWSADTPGVSLDSAGGTIGSGQTVVVQVSVPVGQQGGSATITLEPGGITVAVSWVAGLAGALPSSLGL